jgi:hypothetical protein
MSLTSYRAAPPRDNLCIWAPACAGASFGLFVSLRSPGLTPVMGLTSDGGCFTPRQNAKRGAGPARFEGYVATVKGNGKGAARNFSSTCHETAAEGPDGGDCRP